ncbi:signal peptidase I [Candidatus Nitrososphaera evergladensis SR1]|uniref:Signal peptidase I n=1 Tax=Candidatus Nitrososphaera evergladensis SR1 TaxID=1459636 RepID=A0A075MNH2_9ARCH|nr:signal peptidase I [Candidatus Nitrososphaera evergladensis]AIF82700.1 signal peptidase I [Candidatus Nitrososphaera evergladensis SR1]
MEQKSKLPVAMRDIIIVVAGVAIVWLGLRLAFDTNNPFYVVSSRSMVPVLQVNDVLVVRDGGSWDTLKVGDIIVFDRPDGEDRVIVHRVAEIGENSAGERVIRTKGDANPASIPGTDFPIHKDNYIGKVVYVLPGAGVITKIISPPVNYIIIAIILVILFFSKWGRKGSSSSGASQPPSSSSSSPSSGATSPPPPPST